MYKKIVAVDFDGTLVHNKYPDIENPNMELIEFIKEHREEYIWILWTCRHDDDLVAAVSYMRDEHGIEFDYINENVPDAIEKFGDSRKLGANYYIDDKNISLEALKRQNEEEKLQEKIEGAIVETDAEGEDRSTQYGSSSCCDCDKCPEMPEKTR